MTCRSSHPWWRATPVEVYVVDAGKGEERKKEPGCGKMMLRVVFGAESVW